MESTSEMDKLHRQACVVEKRFGESTKASLGVGAGVAGVAEPGIVKIALITHLTLI